MATAINHRRETLFLFSELPKRMERLTGHRPHISACYRWAESGKLDTVRIAGRLFCSEESIDRLVARSNERRPVAAHLDSGHGCAESELDEAGIGTE